MLTQKLILVALASSAVAKSVNSNLRPNAADAADAAADCPSGVCDAILDPVTNLQFRSINVSVLDTTNPFCVNFNNKSNTEGFNPCPGHYDNVAVNVFDAPSPDDPINPLRGDYYLHVRDLSGGSLTCGTGSEYTGDWTNVAKEKCYKFCFDVGLFYDGCTASQSNCVPGANGGYYLPNIYPTVVLQGGAPNYYRAAFRANQHMTDPDGDSPGWRRVCAPLAPLNADGNLPQNEDGKWYMAAPNNILSGLPPVAGPPSPNTAWNSLLADVTAIQLPVDYTGNPAERIGYDHICLEEGDCTDTCDPEPLCFWKHEWKCEDAKNEDWYGNLTNLLGHIRTFDSRNLCICDVLNQCCPDICEIAEQEYLALLLNLASGKVELDCGVKECGDCVLTIKEVIKLVDRLLAFSSRSDYDCSKALQYLTGINQDEILCDSTGDCPQSERCRLSAGKCVKKDTCDPTQGVTCIDDYCEEQDCTCMVSTATVSPTDRPTASPTTEHPTDSPTTEHPTGPPIYPPSPTDRPTESPVVSPAPIFQGCSQNIECTLSNGECVDSCIPIPGLVRCDPDLCFGDECFCKIKFVDTRCQQTSLCTLNQGTCVKKSDCVGICEDKYCNGVNDCTCQIPDDTPPCETNLKCKALGTGGVCTRDCEPIEGVVQCANDVCPEQDCYCKNCLQNDDQCTSRGGKCLLARFCAEEALNNPNLACNREFCGGPNSECACLLPKQTLPNQELTPATRIP